jgi:biopolymer transport protein ExbD
MSRRRRYRIEAEESGVDLTPMLDVVFIMLIFFIVTASFTREFGIDLTRPDVTKQESETKKKSILISIDRHGEVWIRKRRIDIRAVRANVERLLAENPQAAVLIRADRDAENGPFVRVVDQAKLAGATSVALAAPPTD